MAVVPPVAFINSAPNKNGGHTPIKTALMEMRHTRFWDLRVQPSILLMSERADRYWVWTTLRGLFPLAQLRKGYRCIGYTILVQTDLGKAIPAGMILLIEAYPYLDAADLPTRQSIFLWFLTSAPDSVLRRLGVAEPPSLGKVLVDIGMAASANLGFKGEIGLHAAASGKIDLLDFYGNPRKVGLRHLSMSASLAVTRKNDGRFFVADEKLAQGLLVARDAQRQWPTPVLP